MKNVQKSLFLAAVISSLFFGNLVVAAPKTAWVEPRTGMEFVFVPGGCFEMGDSFGMNYPWALKHEVCVNDYYIGKFEVKQSEWKAVMGTDITAIRDAVDPKLPLHGIGENLPVYYMSWSDAKKFTEQFARQTKKDFRLPTEAEWEYAARSGGNAERYAGSSELADVGWYDENSGGNPHLVGEKKPNGLGIYDMSGNVLEWVNDWYDDGYYNKSPRLNPLGPGSGGIRNDRTHRGGSWLRKATDAMTIYRGCNDPGDARQEMGFRVVLPAGEVAE